MWFSVIHQEESAIGTPMSPLSQTLLPSLSLPHPSACYRAPVWVPLSCRKSPLAICFTHGIVNFYVTLSIHLPFSLLSSHLVQRSVFYVCFSTATLKINSSVPSLQIPYICVIIQYLYFSFWLTSLWIMGSSFVHLIRTDSNVFLFMAEQYSIVYMYHSFFIHSSVDGHLGCFHVLAIVNRAQWTLGYMCLFQFWFPQGICLGEGLLGHMVVLFLAF